MPCQIKRDASDGIPLKSDLLGHNEHWQDHWVTFRLRKEEVLEVINDRVTD